MKQWIKTYSPYIVIGICLIWIVLNPLFSSLKQPHVETIYITDTITITKIDTLELVSPIFVTKKIVDTFFIYLKDSTKISFPIEQKLYKEEGRYEAWVSGINPKLDKINVFNKTEYKTITNTVTNTVYKNAWKGYIGGEIATFDNKVMPSINLMLISPKSLAFGVGYGMYDNKAVYKFNVSYKIFGK